MAHQHIYTQEYSFSRGVPGKSGKSVQTTQKKLMEYFKQHGKELTMKVKSGK